MKIFGKTLGVLGLSLALFLGCIFYACQRPFNVDQYGRLYASGKEAGETYHRVGA